MEHMSEDNQIIHDLQGALKEKIMSVPESERLALLESMIDQSIKDMKDDFMAYAIYVLILRALPDVRDGFKSVHRRILYAMHTLGARPESKTLKSARIVGDIIGKYHPHGDTAVYEAMVKMTQDFYLRVPLIKGQGNFGSIDGDSPAAMRYSEAKLNHLGMLSLGSALNHDSVDYRPNFDETLNEPEVLPAEIPNLIINGASGIAVAIVSEFMPHNLKEVLNACIALLNKKKGMYKTTSVPDLIFKHVQGPDFPTGGIAISPEGSLREAYMTGRGLTYSRARIEIEQLPKGKYQLVITELPYGVLKAPFVKDTGDFINPDPNDEEAKKKNSKKKSLALLFANIEDQSDKHGIRIVLTPSSKDLDPEELIMHLYSVTSLQTTIQINHNALVTVPSIDEDGNPEMLMRPRQIPLPDAFETFLDFREHTLIRQFKYKLNKIDARLHILEGLILAINNIDAVIKIIRWDDTPSETLMKTFSLSELQVEAIVSMRLMAIQALRVDDTLKEQARLIVEKDGFEQLLGNDELRIDYMITRFKEIIKKHGDERRTVIETGSYKARTINPKNTVPKEPATVMITKRDWVKFLKGRDPDLSKTKMFPGDEIKKAIPCFTNETAVFIGKTGKAYSTIVAKMPNARTEGKSIGALFNMGDDKIVDMFVADQAAVYFVATNKGFAMRMPGDTFVSAASKGKQVITMAEADTLFMTKLNKDIENAYVLFMSNEKRAGLIKLDEFKTIPKGKGVKSISMKGDEQVVSAVVTEIKDGKVFFNGENINLDYESLLTGQGKTPKKIDTRVFKRILELVTDNKCLISTMLMKK